MLSHCTLSNNLLPNFIGFPSDYLTFTYVIDLKWVIYIFFIYINFFISKSTGKYVFLPTFIGFPSGCFIGFEWVI
jgi:hypothetical protein